MNINNEEIYRIFVNGILKRCDLDVEVRIPIIQEIADECYCRDFNLLFLECQVALKELYEEKEKG